MRDFVGQPVVVRQYVVRRGPFQILSNKIVFKYFKITIVELAVVPSVLYESIWNFQNRFL